MKKFAPILTLFHNFYVHPYLPLLMFLQRNLHAAIRVGYINLDGFISKQENVNLFLAMVLNI